MADGGDFDEGGAGGGGGARAPSALADARSALPVYAGVFAFVIIALGGLFMFARSRHIAYEKWLDEDPQRRAAYKKAQKKKAGPSADD